MTRLQNPFPIFYDTQGLPLDAGFVYIGVAGADPETDPIDVYADADLTIPLTQPLRTSIGLIVDGLNPTFVYFAEDDYSIKVTDANGHQVYYISNVGLVSVAYQPLDSALTAITLLSTTAYGRALLTLANQAALQSAVGLPAALPLIGGTVSGNIVRSGAGVHPYFFDAAMTGGRIFITASGASDPTSLPGDIWLQTA